MLTSKTSEHLSVYNDLSLNTDLYQLTMAQGYWADGRQNEQACFHLFFRSNPFGGGYAVAAGTGTLSEYLDSHFEFDKSDLDYLSEMTGNDGEPLFAEGFLQHLDEMEFECSVHSVHEGEVVFPHEPIVRVTGPIIQAQLVETPALNLVNYQTLVATKTRRIVEAADGDPVLEFGLRRAQGPDGGLSASRGAYIGGAAGTSNVSAGKHFDIPVKGTHAHSWVQSYNSEREAFRAFADSQPNNSVFLVDTYDTLKGVDKAIAVGREMRDEGFEMVGIRLDSGDLAWLSQKAREKLDKAGFEDAKIVASNSLDERTIQSLRRQGAEIDIYGVGTNLVTCKGDPSLGGVYKLAATKKSDADRWRLTMKLSERRVKRSIPGVLNVRRYIRDDGEFGGDMIFHEGDPWGEPSSDEIHDPMDPHKTHECQGDFETLLYPMFDRGNLLEAGLPSLEEAKAHCEERVRKGLNDGHRRFENPHVYPVGLENILYRSRQTIINERMPD